MERKVRFAVVLAGCGNKDGAEIQESVLTLLAIDKNGGEYQCFAPYIAQKRVLNFLTNEELNQERNVLVESARIARSKINPLRDFDFQDFDVLILPGGNGVAHNLCSFALDGAGMSVDPDVKNAVLSMHRARKPIGALCIAPVLLGKLIPNAQLTFGQDAKINAIFQRMGATVRNTTVKEIVIDITNKLVTTPCYMLDARIGDLAEGIDALVKALIQLIDQAQGDRG